MMQKDWFFNHADLTETNLCFKDEYSFLIFIHNLGWKSGIKVVEVIEQIEQDVEPEEDEDND